ncbi:uncharacterized protein LOC142827537 [Pelodiscus sinensis]|uniref:uncharacterized protein LOC142827537 n=1 Tax=Pelodiscus sinensis TaxID=13735 RepID=UPI003F6CC5A2
MSAPEPTREPAPPFQEPRQSSQQTRRGTKRHAPCWSIAEVKALLDLWGQEGALQEPRSRYRNADIFGRVARALTEQGHPARTLEQVRAKVKELRLAYVRASEGGGAGSDTCPHYKCLHALLGDTTVEGPSPLVDTGLCTSVVRPPDLKEEGDLTTTSKEEGEDRTATITLHLKPVPSSQDISRALSEAGDVSSAGPAGSDGRSSPVLPALMQGPARWTRQHNQLLRQHVQAVERVAQVLTNQIQADLEWQQQAWGQFLQCCDPMCDIMSTMMAHIVHAVHYGMALPPPAAPLLCLCPLLLPPPPPCPCPLLLPLILPTSPCCLPQPGMKGAEAPSPETLGGAVPPSSNSPPRSEPLLSLRPKLMNAVYFSVKELSCLYWEVELVQAGVEESGVRPYQPRHQGLGHICHDARWYTDIPQP